MSFIRWTQFFTWDQCGIGSCVVTTSGKYGAAGKQHRPPRRVTERFHSARGRQPARQATDVAAEPRRGARNNPQRCIPVCNRLQIEAKGRRVVPSERCGACARALESALDSSTPVTSRPTSCWATVPFRGVALAQHSVADGRQARRRSAEPAHRLRPVAARLAATAACKVPLAGPTTARLRPSRRSAPVASQPPCQRCIPRHRCCA
jgi:hypothetical protein